jgi:hypothetical protein
MTPKSATATAQPDISEKTPEEADEISHVIVNLFDKLIGPMVSQMGDLTIGVLAGGAAGEDHRRVRHGRPVRRRRDRPRDRGPSWRRNRPHCTVVAEMLSNRLEESLNRTEFEEGLTPSKPV